MRVLFVAGEEYPFSLHDMEAHRIGCLAEALACNGRGGGVSVMLPLYFSVKESVRSRMKHLGNVSFLYGWRKSHAALYRLRSNGVEYYFIENDGYFGRKRNDGYGDDGERYAFFAHAVLAVLGEYLPLPTVLVANGWKASAVLMAVTYLPQYAHFSHFQKVLIPGNVREQGVFPAHMRGEIFALGEAADLAVQGGNFHLLCGGILCADTVLAPSEEVFAVWQREGSSGFFAETVNACAEKFRILADGFGARFSSKCQGYTASTVIEGKGACKNAYLQSMDFADRSAMLVAVTGELTEEGSGVFLRYLPRMLEENVRIVFCGMGRGVFAERLAGFAQSYPGRLRVVFSVSSEEKIRLLAAADLCVVLSSSALPMDIGDAFSFGTPVLAESDFDGGAMICNGGLEQNGFSFSGGELFFPTFQSACALYGRRGGFHRIFRNAIRTKQTTWRESAELFLQWEENGV